MSDWASIKQKVEDNGNVLTVKMKTLKQVHGNDRLGANVVENIKNQLADIGIGHVPTTLPATESHFIRLYIKSTPMGELIEKVLSNELANTIATPNIPNDEKLKAIFKSEVLVEKIRQLVNDQY
jgi:hypothetical protein